MDRIGSTDMSFELEEVQESPVESTSNFETGTETGIATEKTIKRTYSDFSFTRGELADAVALLDDTLLARRASFKGSVENASENFSTNISNQTLYTVCRSGDSEMLLRLLRHSSVRKKINALDEDDLSPLHLCAKYNHYRCAKILVQYGASVQVLGYNNTTPLHYCAVYRKFKTKSLPMSSNPNSTDTHKLNSISSGYAATTTLTPNAFNAINKIAKVLKDEEDNQRNLIFLFAKEAKPPVDVNAVDKYGSTALHMASYKANTAAVKDLLECNANINCRDGQKSTPLMLAASYSSPDIFKILLEKGADYLLVNGEGSSALHLAAASEKTEIIRMLLEVVKTRSKQLLCYQPGSAERSHLKEFLGMRNKSTETALHIAVSSNQLGAAKVLLENGASAMEIQLDNMYYPMHLAAQNGELPMMELIFKHALLETKNEQKVISVTNRDLQTPLHRAVMFNRVECAKFLLEKGKGNDINMQEKDGFTPLLLAISHGHLEVSALLVKSGADIKVTDFDQKNVIHWAVESFSKAHLQQLLSMFSEFDTLDLINDRDNFGNAPAHLAARNGNLEILQMLHECQCDLKLKNEDEQTPLHLAAKYGRTRVVRWICKQDCDLVKDEDEDSNTPLHIAAIEGHVKVSEVLINFQADVQARNFQQWTPLDCAASKGWVKTARLLLDSDSPIDPMDKSGITPLYLACMNGHADMVKLLLDWDADVETRASDGRNPLDIAIESRSVACVEAILSHPDRWQDALRNRTPLMDRDDLCCDTPLRKLIRTMPDQALKVFSNCIKWNNCKADDENLEMSLLFEFIDDSYSMTSWSYARNTDLSVLDVLDSNSVSNQLEATQRSVHIAGDEVSLDDKASLGLSAEVYEDDGTLNSTAVPYTTVAQSLVDNHCLSIMVNSKAEHLLRHPLVTILLHYKWNNFGRYVYYANLSQYCVFLIFLTGYMIVTKPRAFWNEEFNGTLLHDYIQSEFSRTNFWAYSFFHRFGKWLIIITAIFNVVRELFQLSNKGWAYVSQIVNFLEWKVYLLALVVSVPNVFDVGVGDDIGETVESVLWQCGAVSLFLAWINLILFIQKFPKLGIYVVMFTDVLQTFFKFFAVFILFIVAFAMGFYCLLQNQEDFSTVVYAMIRTMVMMIGEFDYTDTFFGDVEISGIWRFSSLSFFTVFMVIMSIITMNLLVGLAVDDIKLVQENASLQRMAMQVNMALEVEQAVPEWVRRRFIVREQKYYPNKGRTLMWNKIFTNKLDGPSVIKKMRVEREPIEEVELKQEKILQTLRSLEKGLRDLRSDQDKMMTAVTKLAIANGISTEHDDYAGEVNDDED